MTTHTNETVVHKSYHLDDLNALPLGELFSAIINAKALESIIDLAIGEDLAARGDITTTLIAPADAKAVGKFVPHSAGTLAGVVLLPRIAHRYDEQLKLKLHMADGADLQPGDVIAEISGPLRSILTAERTMLNFLTHLSGIATMTNRFVDATLGRQARICDTRKTIPGMRRLEKYAVRCGGGHCHRIGLHDGVLIKDNHLACLNRERFVDEIRDTITRARNLRPEPAFVEVEVDTLDQLRQVLPCDVDIILLDNMPVHELRQAVALRDQLHGSVQLEASGGVNLDTVVAIADTGVDRIAVGALTHSAPALDIGLDVQLQA